MYWIFRPGGFAIWLGAVIITGCAAQNGHCQESALPVHEQRATFKISTSLSPERTRRDDHPLNGLIASAEEVRERIRREVHDYTCYLVKRERIDGELLEAEHMYIKFRESRDLPDGSHVPYSIYSRVLAPKRVENREVLFVQGRLHGDMLVTRGGRRHTNLTLQIDPKGGVAMRDNRYAISDFGMENLLKRLIDVAKADLAFDECQVRVLNGARVDDRNCTVYVVTHPVPRDYFRYHLAQVFLDDQLQVPIRFASYSWPPQLGDQPVLEEEYTYRRLKLNVGLTDHDFDPDNPEYGFSLRD